MAVLKAFTVFYNKGLSTARSAGTTLTKAQAEAAHGKLGSANATQLVIPDQFTQRVTSAEVEAETAEAACIAARLFLGASAGEGELSVAESNKIEKKPSL